METTITMETMSERIDAVKTKMWQVLADRGVVVERDKSRADGTFLDIRVQAEMTGYTRRSYTGKTRLFWRVGGGDTHQHPEPKLGYSYEAIADKIIPELAASKRRNAAADSREAAQVEARKQAVLINEAVEPPVGISIYAHEGHLKLSIQVAMTPDQAARVLATVKAALS